MLSCNTKQSLTSCHEQATDDQGEKHKMFLFRSKTQEENQDKDQWDQDTDEAQCEEKLCHYHEGCKAN